MENERERVERERDRKREMTNDEGGGHVDRNEKTNFEKQNKKTVSRHATAIPLGRKVIGVTHYRRTGRYEAHIWISGKDAENFEREGRKRADGGRSSEERNKKRKSDGGEGEGGGEQQQQQKEKKSRGYQLHLVSL